MVSTRKLTLVILFSFINLFLIGQRNKVVNELFYLSGGYSYNLNGNLHGVTGKFAFPMQKGFNFVFQGSAFPSQFSKRYDEFRYEYNVELIPISFGKFSPYFQIGFNYGWVRRTHDIVTDNAVVEPTGRFIKDESMLFGWGINYQMKGVILFVEHKHYPNIYSDHFSAGVKILVFENKLKRKYYMLKRQKRANKL